MTLYELMHYARKGYRITITDKYITLQNRRTKEETSFSVLDSRLEMKLTSELTGHYGKYKL